MNVLNNFRYRRNNPGLEQAIIGTELLRLAGGPNRGWYPTRKGNQPRPVSIEHLERLNSAYDARLPGTAEQRKPLTLPTNITPNKYFGQSKHSSASTTREALRRVTSLLIKKGKRRNWRRLNRQIQFQVTPCVTAIYERNTYGYVITLPIYFRYRYNQNRTSYDVSRFIATLERNVTLVQPIVIDTPKYIPFDNTKRPTERSIVVPTSTTISNLPEKPNGPPDF